MTAFDANDYLLLAKQLRNCSESDQLYEASQRSAISRAYYSVFLPARAKKGRTDTGHRDLFEIYQNGGDHLLVSIGNRLKSFYALRCNADYGDLLVNPDWSADDALQRAEDLIKLINKIP